MAQKLYVTKEELDKIKDLNTRYSKIFNDLGQLEIDMAKCKSEKEDLLEEYGRVEKEEINFGAKLKERYGEGKLDLVTGEITPS